MDFDQNNLILPANFFEWGIKAAELQTTSSQIVDVAPISGISFMWNTAPTHNTYGDGQNTNKTYGIGQFSFEMRSTNTRPYIQDTFVRKKRLENVTITKYINQNGQPLESEIYTFDQCMIALYKFEVKLDGSTLDYLTICSNGKQSYKIIIRKTDGTPLGNQVNYY